MTNPRALLDAHEISPKKALGQNFIHDPNLLDKIVTTAELTGTETVVEVGPGTGAMTAVLAQHAARVVAIELDDRLAPVLSASLAPYTNVQVYYADALKVDIPALAGDTAFQVVANIPYYISSHLIRHLLEAPIRPQRLVLTVQHELAERITAGPGHLSLLAVSVQFYGVPQLVTRINPAVFWPRPEVDSAILRVDTHPAPVVDVPSDAAFFRVAKAGFSQKRKQLKNALGGGLAIKASAAGQLIEAAGIDSARRAETLTLDEWAALTRAVVGAGVIKA